MTLIWLLFVYLFYLNDFAEYFEYFFQSRNHSHECRINDSPASSRTRCSRDTHCARLRKTNTGTPGRGACVSLFWNRRSLAFGDCAAGANFCAAAAADAGVRVDVIDFTFRDCAYGANRFACATCHAVISNYVCHNSLCVLINCLVVFRVEAPSGRLFGCKINFISPKIKFYCRYFP